MWLITESGERYLDFGAGVAVTSVGHSHPHVVGALKGQADKVWHLSNIYEIPGQERLAKRLTDATFAEKVFFTNSGAEALECAIKTARRYHFANGNPERTTLITFKNAFHGRTLGTISATDQEKMRGGFEPLLPGFAYAPFDDLVAAEALVDDNTAGFLVEPIQGEGGIRAASPEFLQGLRRICDERGLLLVLDEVQCGVARTGTLYAYEQYGVTPDIVATAKGIGGGFPLGACLATEDAAKGMVIGTHGSTYGGNPLAMAAGNAVLDVILEPGFMEQVQATGARLRAALEQMIPNHDGLFDSVRGMGLMLGLKMKTDSRRFVAHLRNNHNLLTVAAGENVVRVLPPLIIEQAQIDEFVTTLSEAARLYVPPADE